MIRSSLQYNEGETIGLPADESHDLVRRGAAVYSTRESATLPVRPSDAPAPPSLIADGYVRDRNCEADGSPSHFFRATSLEPSIRAKSRDSRSRKR